MERIGVIPLPAANAAAEPRRRAVRRAADGGVPRGLRPARALADPHRRDAVPAATADQPLLAEAPRRRRPAPRVPAAR